jgi:hypothetical protein
MVQVKKKRSTLAGDLEPQRRCFSGLSGGMVRAWEVARNANVPDHLRLNSTFLNSISTEISRGVHSISTLETFIAINRVDLSFERLADVNLLSSIDEITELEAIAIHRYTVSSFDLNGNFYSQSPNAEDLAWAGLMDNAIDALQSSSRRYEGLVHRGQNIDYQLVHDKYISVYNRAQATGSPAYVTETGYLSTSIDENVANHFIGKFYNAERIQVRFKIISKTGVDIDDISDYGANLCASNSRCDLAQSEVIIKRDQVFDILDIKDVEEIIDGIDMTIKEITVLEL